MNDEQANALKIALDGHNLLVTGSPGTGKSFLVQEIFKCLTSLDKNVQLTCSTGIACQVYSSAMTIHQFTGICDGRYSSSDIESVLLNNSKFDIVVEGIRKCETLIVDECSMISEKTFETIERACRVKCPTKLFGGLQVIFVGDFHQLSPVVNNLYGDSGNFCFQSPLFQKVFPHTVELQKNNRQNDRQLIDVINEVFSGQLTDESRNYISFLSRPIQDDSDSIKLFSKNHLCDDYNRQRILHSKGDLHQFTADDTGITKQLHSLTAPKILWLKIGSPVLLVRNLTKNLVNGSRGTVLHIDSEGPTVHFGEVNCTMKLTQELFTVYNPTLRKDIASRKQIPLRLAFGLTIHKSQGMTLERVAIDCREIFRPGQLGVAISRAKSSEGLQIIHFHERYLFEPSLPVTEFYQNLPRTRPLSDLSCCRSAQKEASHDVLIQAGQLPSSYCDTNELEIDTDNISDDDMDDDFNEIIQSIPWENDDIECEIPNSFKMNLKDTKFERELTDFHKHYNMLVSTVQEENVNTFVKKIFIKVQEIQQSVFPNMEPGKPIAEKRLVEFYRLIHEYSLSTEYKINCWMLFPNESVTDVHQAVAYNIFEMVRVFIIQQKAETYSGSKRKLPDRKVTESCKARIRYVAGYCVAKLRMKYLKLKTSSMYSSTGKDKYKVSKCVLALLDILTENEHFLATNTSEPDSLLDVHRKQNQSHGLTSITDEFYLFFCHINQQGIM